MYEEIKPRMIYLASPYSTPAWGESRHVRFVKICEIAAELIRADAPIFCPIAHSHPIADFGALPLGIDYWGAWDRQMLNNSTDLWVVGLDGWEYSHGVYHECEYAAGIGIQPMLVVNPTMILDKASGKQFCRQLVQSADAMHPTTFMPITPSDFKWKP